MADSATSGITRLALGIELIDAARDLPALMPLIAAFDDPLQARLRPPVLRHPSNRFSLAYDAYLATQARTVTLRFFDGPGERYDVGKALRHLVPRRLRLSLPSLTQAETRAPAARVCRPRLFPGASYPVTDVQTGLRGRVMRRAGGGRPVRPARWVRVLATLPPDETELTAATVVGRAFGDDRGEFVLLLRPSAAVGPPVPAIPFRLTVFARPNDPAPTPADLPQRDALWDLPIETPLSFRHNNDVLRGAAIPNGYTKVAETVLEVPVGRLLRGQPDVLI